MSKGRGYAVLIKRSAEKKMDRLPPRTFERLTRAILRLETLGRIWSAHLAEAGPLAR